MDKRVQKMIELLKEAAGGIQMLEIQATAMNVESLHGALTNIQIVVNTLDSIQHENEEKEEGDADE